MPNKAEILNQLHSLRHTHFDEMLTNHAQAHGLGPSFFFAIASHETNCINELGDFQGGQAHGVGIVQIDIQHPIALQARDSGSWKTNPEPLIEFGAQLLAANLQQAQQAFPSLGLPQQLKIAASGYNCGMQHAIAAAQSGDSDKMTTGHDYGRDVMTRMAIFDELIAEGN